MKPESADAVIEVLHAESVEALVVQVDSSASPATKSGSAGVMDKRFDEELVVNRLWGVAY
jgi:hypothetical protein